MPRRPVRPWFVLLLLLALLPVSADLVSAQRRSGGSRSSGSSSRSSSGTSRQSTSTPREVRVRGYYRRDGTYVQPHSRTAADGNFNNNWSTYGNVNPHTGRPGTKTTPPPGYGQDVWVNGYYRTDGTYVPGHYRTAPDGDPSNNYSTRGNTNPYTGEAGTVSPPSSTSYSYEEVDRNARVRAAETLRGLGYDVDWQSYSYYQLSDMALRIRQARRLEELGVTADWQKHTYSEMSDWSLRIGQARRLAEMGESVNWRDHTYSEMSDWALRIRQAQRLAELGLNVNWRDHSYSEMSDWALRIRLANELRQAGVTVDWRQYTYYQLSEMRRKARER